MNKYPSRQISFENTGNLAKFVTGLTLALVTACSSSGPKTATQPTETKLAQTTSPAATPYKSLVPGCEIYSVYSQNRYQPYGTFVHDVTNEKNQIPTVTSPKATDVAFAPNQIIPVDGWKSIGQTVYPGNISSVRRNVWLHVAYTKNDWVTFAGVRGEPTVNDVATATHAANTSTDPGALAKLHLECEIK